MFSDDDPRLALSLPADQRIHAALNCGAKVTHYSLITFINLSLYLYLYSYLYLYLVGVFGEPFPPASITCHVDIQVIYFCMPISMHNDNFMMSSEGGGEDIS